jgi:hypothetical protein
MSDFGYPITKQSNNEISWKCLGFTFTSFLVEFAMIQDHILEHQIGPKITIYSYPFGSGADFNV